MQLLDDIKMGPKLMGIFLGTAAVAMCVGMFAISRLQAADEGARRLLDNAVVPMEAWAQATTDTLLTRTYLQSLVLTGDVDRYDPLIAKRLAERNEHEAALEKTLVGEGVRAEWKRYREQAAQVDGVVATVREKVRADQRFQAQGLLSTEGAQLETEQNEHFKELQDALLGDALKLATQGSASTDLAANVMYGIMVVGAFMAALLSIVVSRSIAGPLKKGVEMMSEMGKGHLGLRLRMGRKDELGILARAMDAFTDELQGMVQGLQQIAAGDLSRDFTAHDARDEINPALARATETLRGMSADTRMLVQAAIEGRLATRADASKYHGEYQSIVQGVNATLDAVVAPVNDVMRVMGDLERGDLTARITVEYCGDFQRLAQAINNSAQRLAEALKEIGQAADSLAGSSDELTRSSGAMTSRAEGMTLQANTAAAGTEQASASVANMALGVERMSASANTVASASEEVNSNLRTVGAAVEEMSANMRSIAGATEQMTGSVNVVAAVIDGMSSSLGEVSKSSSQAATVAGKAARAAETTAGTVGELGRSAHEIGKVVELIKGIAAQTNLLALNATIEAASAGEAGKGFSVVAAEVKALAKQTAGATDEIRTQVEGMQANTQRAVKAIDEIVEIIREINTISWTIAAAVDEQTATTSEIARNVGNAARDARDVSRNVQQAATGANEVSRNVQQAVTGVGEITRHINTLALGVTDVARNSGEAARGMNDVARNVGGVSAAAQDTRSGATENLTAARSLARLAEKLQTNVAQFRV